MNKYIRWLTNFIIMIAVLLFMAMSFGVPWFSHLTPYNIAFGVFLIVATLSGILCVSFLKRKALIDSQPFPSSVRGYFSSKKIKIISTLFTFILFPLFLSVTANIVTKSKAEITLNLDGWITIGAVEKSDLSDLKLIYKNKPIENLLKTSLRVVNTGTEGIDSFESGPTIFYPENLKVEKAQVISTSKMLKIDRVVSIDEQSHSISFNDIGIFNPGDFFVTDVYFSDIPNESTELTFINKWNLKAKALNLETKKGISLEIQQKINKIPSFVSLMFYIAGIMAAIVVKYLNLKIDTIQNYG